MTQAFEMRKFLTKRKIRVLSVREMETLCQSHSTKYLPEVETNEPELQVLDMNDPENQEKRPVAKRYVYAMCRLVYQVLKPAKEYFPKNCVGCTHM